MQQLERKEVGWDAGKPLSTVEGIGTVELVAGHCHGIVRGQFCTYCGIREHCCFFDALELSIGEILKDGPL